MRIKFLFQSEQPERNLDISNALYRCDQAFKAAYSSLVGEVRGYLSYEEATNLVDPHVQKMTASVLPVLVKHGVSVNDFLAQTFEMRAHNKGEQGHENVSGYYRDLLIGAPFSGFLAEACANKFNVLPLDDLNSLLEGNEELGDLQQRYQGYLDVYQSLDVYQTWAGNPEEIVARGEAIVNRISQKIESDKVPETSALSGAGGWLSRLANRGCS